MKTARDLDQEIFSLIARGADQPCSDKEFNQLALEIFRYQFAHNVPYQKFCRAQGITPLHVQHWRNIPAVPTTAFKESELTTIPSHQRMIEFRSSGTTRHIPSRHIHSSSTLKLYEASVLTGFRHFVGRLCESAQSSRRFAEAAYIFLTSPPHEAPHSSLAYMMETVRRSLGNGEADYFVRDGVVESQRLLRALREPRPVGLLGTVLAYVQFLVFLARKKLRLKLTRGSFAMETGGFKGQRREIPREEFYGQLHERLGLQCGQIVSEYGMCELSSQFYAVEEARSQESGVRVFRGPPWIRAIVIDPETQKEVSDGLPGLIRVFDLANRSSVLAIQTEDIGIRRGTGFELLGRAPMAEARGCSSMILE